MQLQKKLLVSTYYLFRSKLKFHFFSFNSRLEKYSNEFSRKHYTFSRYQSTFMCQSIETATLWTEYQINGDAHYELQELLN